MNELKVRMAAGSDVPMVLAFIRVPEDYGNLRGLEAAQMCHAIREGRPNIASGSLALHVLEVLEATTLSAQSGNTYDCTTSCEKPAALPYGLAEAQYGF